MSLVINEINTKRFIEEIKFRPCLWDSASEPYKDRELKKRKWMELCVLFHPDFEDSDPKEKSEICKGLQSKWKNIRDCYRKYLKLLETKPGQARKEVKSYLYAEQLSFLQSTLLLGPTEPSPSVERGEVQHNEESDDFVDEGDNTADRPHSSGTSYRRKKKCLQAKLEKYIDSLNGPQAHAEEEDCDDLHFFKSLLPIVKPLPMSDKIKFRMEVMKLAHDYCLSDQQQTVSQSLVRTILDSPTAPRSLQPLFVNTVPGGSSTPPGKAPRPSQRKRRASRPTARRHSDSE